jgi:NADH dehydrogenase [ubiquinone] 1 alpha subcomplex assembly factor 7
MAQKTEKGWHEVLIATTEEPNTTAEGTEAEPKTEAVKVGTPRLRRVLTREPSITSRLLGRSSTRFDSLPVGTTIEVSPNSFRIAHDAGMLLSTEPPLAEAEAEAAPSPDTELGAGGCGLIIDYGGAHAHGTSFRVSSSQISCC